MKEIVEILLADFEPGHSEFQIRNFIVGSKGHLWAQYKSALRQIESLYSNLVELEDKKILAEAEIFKWHFYNPCSAISKAKHLLKRRATNRAYENLLREIVKVKKELGIFVDAANRLRTKIGPISKDREKQLEHESWIFKARRMAIIDKLSYGRISTQTIDFILSLPKPDSFNILKEFEIELSQTLIEDKKQS